MIVLSPPLRLRLAVATLFFTLPLAALEIMIVSRAPWWRLPYRTIAYWCLAFLLMNIPISAWILSARKWAFALLGFLASVWVLASTWLTLKISYPPLGFFTLFLSAYWIAVLFWVRLEMGRSFMDPQLAWYQGLPQPIPGLKCQLSSGEHTVELKVSRVDRDGTFVFHSALKLPPGILEVLSHHKKKKLELGFIFRERRLSCVGSVVVKSEDGQGLGIQFVKPSSDLRKEIGDFVESLRGEGYV